MNSGKREKIVFDERKLRKAIQKKMNQIVCVLTFILALVSWLGGFAWWLMLIPYGVVLCHATLTGLAGGLINGEWKNLQVEKSSDNDSDCL